MGPHLTYRPREGVVFGTVAGKSIRLTTLRNQGAADIYDRTKVQELRTGVPGAAAGKPTLWDHAFEITHKHLDAAGARGSRLTIAENSALEIYDYPGEYAQRFDGVDQGGSTNHRLHGRVVWVKSTTKTRFPGGGFCLHGPPRCGNPRCIVIAQQWDSLYSALKAARQVSIVVEL
jgi:hypothetical protein